ncbi:MAG: hypothetical protein FJ161_03205 [Gammaproteobacteria bacterium]|nr:hypothetical protein [Gammaproteobacteria bacterium]
MGFFDSFFGALLLGFIAWMTYSTIQNRSDLFTRESLSKSFGTMGWLGLGLCCFVALLSWSLPAGQGVSSGQAEVNFSSRSTPSPTYSDRHI